MMSKLPARASAKERPGSQERFAYSLENVSFRRTFQGAVILRHSEKDGDL